MSLANIRIVLVRPRGSANVGSVARAMKNMGLSDLALVQPALTDRFWSEAMAVHAEDVLRSHRSFDSFAEATADCGIVAGTTAHDGPYRTSLQTPRQAAPALLAAAASNRVAVVFGPEDHGLSNDDLKSCQLLLTIPTAPAYPSLNLAQAVMVCCYELQLAVGDAVRADGSADIGSETALASASHTRFALERLQEALLTIGFLKPNNTDHMMYSIRRMLGSAHMDERDVSIWLGIARQIEWLAGCAQSHDESPLPLVAAQRARDI